MLYHSKYIIPKFSVNFKQIEKFSERNFSVFFIISEQKIQPYNKNEEKQGCFTPNRAFFRLKVD